MRDEPLVAVVIVHWGSPIVTLECIRSVHSCSSQNVTIIVIDKMIDIGCGPCGQVDVAKSMGINAVGIDGDPKYIITFAFDKQLIQSMSADLLGIDEDEVDDDVSDKCLKETANIIAGNFMLSFGSGTERNITLPSQQKRNIFGDFTITESTVMVSQFNGLSMNTIIESIEC